jgi:preprotein translocase subunit SecA
MPPTRTQDVIKVLQEVGVGLGIGRRETRRNEGPKVGRNDACTCGSGKKYKRCCGK